MFKFLLSFLLVIMVLTVRAALNPDYDIEKGSNFNVTSGPLTETASRACAETLNKCEGPESCAKCGDDNFTCTPVSKYERLLFKGRHVPEGLWCLPRGKDNVACGTFTGRKVWTTNEWKCSCLYPNLFAGDDCRKQIACGGHSKLVNEPSAQAWDPFDPNFDPTGKTPYALNDKNEPFYQCQCTKDTIRLPYDPYRCHVDGCSPNKNISMWNSKSQKCDCTANGQTQNMYALSNVTKTCVRTDQCNWNDTEQKCMCPENEAVKLCNSRSMICPNAKEQCPDVPGGSYCFNPCKNYCVNYGTPNITGDQCTCTCSNIGNIIVSGKRCEKTCLKDGVLHPQGKCCNGSHYRFHAGKYTKVCGPSSWGNG